METLRNLEIELKEMSTKYNSLKQQFEATNEVSYTSPWLWEYRIMIPY